MMESHIDLVGVVVWATLLAVCLFCWVCVVLGVIALAAAA